MRSIWILVGLLVSSAAVYAAGDSVATTAAPAAESAANSDYIPPSTAIFSGLETAAPPENPAASSGQRMSQSINEALNIAPKNSQATHLQDQNR